MAQRRYTLLTIFVCFFWLAMGCSSSSHNSSTTSGGGSGSTSTGLLLTPATTPILELVPSGTTNTGSVSLAVSASESVTWSLANPTGIGRPAPGATLSSTSGTSTTFTFAGSLQPCSSSTPVGVLVVATTTGTPTQTSNLLVEVEQSPPCLATMPIVSGNVSYTGCPASGTVIYGLLGVSPPYKQLTQVGAYTALQISAGSQGAIPFGVPPFTWSLIGSLPAGLTMTPNTNTQSVEITGTPASPQCSTFQLQITDSTGAKSCDPTVTTSCVATTFNLLVLPAALKVKIPPTHFSYDSVPFSPIAIQTSGGVPPYTFLVDPTGISTPPPGLSLTTPAPNSTFVELAGTPNAGDSNNSNAVGNGPGQYPTLIEINDSQVPYPAVGSVNLNLQDYTLPTACLPSTSTPLSIVPSGPSGNGGSLTGGSILADNYLQGTYAFMLRGFDGGQPSVVAGSMTLDGNGNVTSGVEDYTVGTNSQSNLPITAGTYTVGIPASNPGDVATYNRGCVNLTTSSGTLTFDFTLGGCSNHYSVGGATFTSLNACGMSQNGSGANQTAGTFSTGRLMEADDGSGHSAQLSGILRVQNTSSFASGLSGPYAFGAGGWDSALGHYAMAGSVQASSSSLASAAGDLNDAGSLSSQLTGGTGTLATVDANGRIAGTLTLGQGNFDLALYMVSQGEAFLVTTDPLSASHPVIGGEAISTVSSFSANSLRSAQMLEMGGIAASGPDVSIGLLTFDGVGDVGGTIYEDQAGTVGTTSVSATYAVDGSTGRAPFTTPVLGQTLGAHSFVVYLVPAPSTLSHVDCTNPASCITGFVVGTDSTAQDGILEFQNPAVATPPAFYNQNVVGDFAYGSVESLDPMTTSFEGDVYAVPSTSNTTGGSLGSGQFPFDQDSSYGCLGSICPLFIPNDTYSGTYTINGNGTGTFGGGTTVSVSNGNVIFYIDESPANTQPSVVVAEQ